MTKIWLIEPIEGARDAEGKLPWQPWYDKAFGFVVAAATEDEARKLASEKPGDEGAGVWLDPKLTSCRELGQGEEPRIVLRSIAGA